MGFGYSELERHQRIPHEEVGMTQEAVKDPVCGMTIQPADAVETVEHEGTTYYFCSRDCAESFRDAPEDYV
jgi:YHS domain-containing protein